MILKTPISDMISGYLLGISASGIEPRFTFADPFSLNTPHEFGRIPDLCLLFSASYKTF